MQQNKENQHLIPSQKQQQIFKINNGTIEEVKDFKHRHFVREHVRIVVLWAIIRNNVLKDLEKYQQSIQ